MKNHKIDLTQIAAHGRAETKLLKDKTLDFWTTNSFLSHHFTYLGNDKIKHFISLPGEYRLPLRVDMNIKIDSPAFILLLGGGHISFSTPRQDNRKIDDIAFPSNKPNLDKYSFINSLPYGEYTGISVSCNYDEMQILINGEERFYTARMPYMNKKNKNELEAMNADGFEIKLAVFKHAVLNIKSITIMEFDENAPIKRGNFKEAALQQNNENKKPAFDDLMKKLPQNFRNEVIKMDEYLKSMRTLKFKKIIDKNGGRISYVASNYGISYVVDLSGLESSQNFGWYIITGGKPETWHQKADHMEELLAEIAKSNKELAQRIFSSISDCAGCGSGCKCIIPYKYNGQKRLACHGRVTLRMNSGDFNDVKEFFRQLNNFFENKK